MDISKTLRFVRGSIDESRVTPALENYALQDGRIQGSDGVIALCAPMNTPVPLCVHAARFARAIAACGEDEISLTLTKKRSLVVKAGAFRASIPTSPDVDKFPWCEPEGDVVDVPDNLIEQLTALRPFIGTDATRPWSLGIRIEATHMYATNNVVCVEAACRTDVAEPVTLPAIAVDELLRLKVPPKRILVNAHSMSFLYAKDWWMRSALLSNEWPDMQAVMNKTKGATAKRISDEFRTAFARLLPFFAGTYAPVYVREGALSTSPNVEDAATIEGLDTTVEAAVVAAMLKLVLVEATHIDWSRFPAPIPFVGKRVRGVLATYAPKEDVTRAENTAKRVQAAATQKAR